MNHFAQAWSEQWNKRSPLLENNCVVRITARFKNVYKALDQQGQSINCYVSGRVQHNTVGDSGLPVVGDWCELSDRYIDTENHVAGLVERVLPRSSKIARLSAGRDKTEQVLAANVDLVFIVTSVNRDFSINRLRRYVLLAEYGGVRPVIVLSKSDLDLIATEAVKVEVGNAFPEVASLVTSSIDLTGIDDILTLATAGTTAVFVGSSGVGKSTLVNALMRQVPQFVQQSTGEVRDTDQRGRHTTSSSGLFFLPSGGMIIDTPGLREVGLLGDLDDLQTVMPTVATIASRCRFADCTHATEPECAVVAAMEDGSLSQAEYAAYVKLERELAFSQRKTNQRLAADERKKWKQITVQNREYYKKKWR
jgi:ribosome biogenesis GTPase